MNSQDRFARVEARQEALIAAIQGLVDVVEVVRDMQAELLSWVQQPPPTELPDLLRELTASIQRHSELILVLSRKVDLLFEHSAGTVRT
jgi:hypothetical protein